MQSLFVMRISVWIFLSWLCAGTLWPTLALSAMVDPATPTNAQPVSGGTNWVLAFSDEFNTNVLDTTKWGVDISSKSRSARSDRGIDDWWWVADNVWLDGTNLVLEVDKRDANTMDSGSVSSDGLYEPKYGYLEARIQIADSTKDTHTAFWTQGHNMGNVDGTAHDGAEIDIFESAWFGDYTKSVVHIDGYGADHQASTKQYSTPNLHSGYHVFGLEWNAIEMKIYYDGVHKVTYTGTWVPRTNEYLWLSCGASFGDIGTFTNEAPGLLTEAKVDYVRVWQVDNYTPEFTTDPIVKPIASVGGAYSNTLADVTTDGDLDPLTFSKLSGPSWLTVDGDGVLTGLPTGTDLGTNSWQVQVVDGNGGTNSATLEIEVINPWDPVILVGGSILNGDFNAATGPSVTFSATPNWYNLAGSQTSVATRDDETYDGSQNGLVNSTRLQGIDTGHQILEGESFDLSYVWKDSFNWPDTSGEVAVSLFVTDDNTITGARTDLVSHYSGISTMDGSYESVSADHVYTALAADEGKTLFAAIEPTSTGFGRIDNFQLILRPAYVKPDMEVYRDDVLVGQGDTVTFGTYGTVLTGETANVSFVVTNLASAATNLFLRNTPAVVFSENGQASYNGFTVSANVTGSATNLAPGEAAPFTVEFVTNAVGAYTATVSIANSDLAMDPYVFTLSASVIDDANAPTWSDEFNGSGPPDPSKWWLEEGYKRNNEDQYYMTSGNAWQADGMLVIEARREATNGYDYTSASLRSQGRYSWQYGRAQIRAKIPCFDGMWPAIWMVGDTGEWPSNGECDIMEWYNNKTLSNCARATTTRWTAAWDSASRTMTQMEAVDPGWRTNYHVWTIQWDQENVRLYCDNVLMNTTAQSWLTNPTTEWGPLKPFMQPHNLWLNLAVGGDAGGDPSGTSFPQRYYVDYWRVWEGATNNVAPTGISLSSNSVDAGVPAGTLVGYLSATDSDPAEVIRYSLVAGAGDADNSLFLIPEFISDNTTMGRLETSAELDYTDVGTRSIRVRATDIEGATYEKILSITVAGPPPAPTGLSATPSVGQVELSWASVSNAVSYIVKRSTTSGSGYNQVGAPTGTNFSDTVSNGATYYYVVSAVNADGEGPDSPEVSAALFHVMPFAEDFESRTLGDLDGQNGWEAVDTVVQTNVAVDAQAARITSGDGYAKQQFAVNETSVWTDFVTQPVFAADDLVPPDTNCTTFIYFNTNGNAVVYDGTNRLVLSGMEVSTGAWVRVTVNSDYTAKIWDLYLNGVNVANDLDFYYAAQSRYEAFTVKGGAAGTGAVFDDVSIGTDSPFGESLMLTVISDHGVPTPDGTTLAISNTTVDATISGSPVINGATQFLATGWAGSGSGLTSGTDTNFSFTITEDTTITWQWQTNYWIELNVVGE